MKSEAKTIIQNFRITPAFQRELFSLATKQSKTVSGYIRESVEAKVASEPKTSWLVSSKG